MMIGHKKQWEFLKKKVELNQLAHAYLFTGNKGIGKKTFATEFAEFVGCKFPDLLIVESEENDEIQIKKIREAQKFLSYKAYNGGFKIVIVDNAERMNIEAQSCFLKTLEEPNSKTMLILVSSKPDMLLPTIASRCQTLKFSKQKGHQLSPEKLKREKEILNNLLPVIDSSLADKFQYVKSIDFDNGPGGTPLGEILEVMQKYYRDVLLKDYKQKKVIKILNLIEDINNKLLFTNVNSKLALEILLMET